MKNTETLDAMQLAALLSELDGWQVVDGMLYKVFVFNSFIDAFGFMTKVALAAEKADHHPNWSNVYRTVTINLMTHSSGGITYKDTDLAAAIDLMV